MERKETMAKKMSGREKEKAERQQVVEAIKAFAGHLLSEEPPTEEEMAQQLPILLKEIDRLGCYPEAANFLSGVVKRVPETTKRSLVYSLFPALKAAKYDGNANTDPVHEDVLDMFATLSHEENAA